MKRIIWLIPAVLLIFIPKARTGHTGMGVLRRIFVPGRKHQREQRHSH